MSIHNIKALSYLTKHDASFTTLMRFVFCVFVSLFDKEGYFFLLFSRVEGGIGDVHHYITESSFLMRWVRENFLTFRLKRSERGAWLLKPTVLENQIEIRDAPFLKIFANTQTGCTSSTFCSLLISKMTNPLSPAHRTTIFYRDNV